MTGREIQQHWESKMSPQGINDYQNDPVYREITDPVNYIAGAAGKVGKVAGVVTGPMGEAVGLVGKVIENNSKLRKASRGIL